MEQSFDNQFLKIVGPAIFSALVVVFGWLTGEAGNFSAALKTVLTVIGGLSALTFSMMYQRYLGVLASGGARKGSPARAAYDSLRESLSGENLVSRIYVRRLRAFLDGMERFFGDAGMADRTLFPHFLGLKSPAPLWTAPAFERCLLTYPIVTIVLIWVISGHIGPAEAALHLPPGTSGWRRAAGVVLILFSAYAWLQCYQTEGWIKKFVWFVVASVSGSAIAGVYATTVVIDFAVAFAVAFAGAFAGAFGFAIAFAIAGAGAIAATIAVAVAATSTGVVAVAVTVMVTLAVAFAFIFAGSFAGTFAFAVAIAIAVTSAAAGTLADAAAFAGANASIGSTSATLAILIVVTFLVAFLGVFFGAFAFAGALALAFTSTFAIISHLARGARSWTFLVILVAGMLILVIGIPALLASGPVWATVGPLFLFIGLLTLINAPFDWISLGMTRALLRRGLELGSWWPYFFALADAALAAFVITLLAAAMVIGVQAFDTVTVHSGGEPVLLLKELFDGITTRPSEPEYWWLYALLVSSMIPSILNLAIGGIAFLRGVPKLPSVVLYSLPAGKAVARFDRAWIALVLTGQTFLGACLGVAAQAVLAVGIIGYGLPWLGFRILDVARDIATFNFPEQVWALFVG
jgi:hypothetical protein